MESLPTSQLVRNRRFKKLQQLIEEGDYFSEDQVKTRDPLMYHMYVGRFIRNEGAKGDQMIMSDFIFQRINEQEYTSQLEKEYKAYKEKTGKSYFAGQIDEAYETDEQGEPLKIGQEELEENEDELIRMMHERFMRGEDTEWIDYRLIDQNSEYDDKEQEERDNQDKWFEEEEQVSEEKQETQQESVYTGVLDY